MLVIVTDKKKKKKKEPAPERMVMISRIRCHLQNTVKSSLASVTHHDLFGDMCGLDCLALLLLPYKSRAALGVTCSGPRPNVVQESPVECLETSVVHVSFACTDKLEPIFKIQYKIKRAF